MVVMQPSASAGTTSSGPRAGSAPPTRGRVPEHLEEKPSSKLRHSPRRGTRPRIPTRPQSSKMPADPAKPAAKQLRGRRTTAKRATATTRRSQGGPMLVQPRRYSIAMCRTESILAASSGDVVVCRCRRSSLPYLPPKEFDHQTSWQSLMPCCDGDFMSIGRPERAWSPFDFDNRLSANVGDSDSSNLYEWDDPDEDYMIVRQGLLGGAMHKPMPKVNTHRSHSQSYHHPSPFLERSRHRRRSGDSDLSTESTASDAEKLVDNIPKLAPQKSIEEETPGFEGDLLPMPSFDYSHIRAGHNDMAPLSNEFSRLRLKKNPNLGRRSEMTRFPSLPEHTVLGAFNQNGRQENDDHIPPTPELIHGVPSFLPTLSQIRVAKVSAHPQGAHVLMISSEALLFTYGLNNHGQLGIGTKSDVRGADRGFVTRPTIITPLLENGGKTINCAAGMNHSLVVVQTEGRRLEKFHSSKSMYAQSETGSLHMRRTSYSMCSLDGNSDDELHSSSGSPRGEAVQHHQVYGFGSNSLMKIGLVNAVASDLDNEEDRIPHECDGFEDVLLPRRVALHCSVWPKRSRSQNSRLPPEGIYDIAASREHSAALVRRATGNIEVYTWGNATLGALGIPFDDECPPDSDSSNGVDSLSRNKIIPIPDRVDSLTYDPNGSGQNEFPTGLSLGPRSSFVTMSSGRCMSFGYSAEGMLGQGVGITHSITPGEVKLPTSKDSSRREKIVSVSAGAHHVMALTATGHVYAWGISSHGRLGVKVGPPATENARSVTASAVEPHPVIQWTPTRINLESKLPVSASLYRTRAIGICAGFDGSMIVAESGQVLSFGRRSGRLGLGDVTEDVESPETLYGGFRLFHQREAQRKKEPPPTRARSTSATRRVGDV